MTKQAYGWGITTIFSVAIVVFCLIYVSRHEAMDSVIIEGYKMKINELK